MTPTHYLQLKDTLTNTLGIIKNGKLYAIYNGKEIEESEFRKMFVIPDRLWAAKENPCKKVKAIS